MRSNGFLSYSSSSNEFIAIYGNLSLSIGLLKGSTSFHSFQTYSQLLTRERRKTGSKQELQQLECQGQEEARGVSFGLEPSTYPLIGKSRDLLPTGRDRTANLLAPDCQSYLFFAHEVYEASPHWGDSDLFNSTTTICTQVQVTKDTINTRKEVFYFWRRSDLVELDSTRAIVEESSCVIRVKLSS